MLTKPRGISLFRRATWVLGTALAMSVPVTMEAAPPPAAATTLTSSGSFQGVRIVSNLRNISHVRFNDVTGNNILSGTSKGRASSRAHV